MRNRFDLNESEKNRIRGLHGIHVINENIGAQIQASLDDEAPNATEADYDRFIKCLEAYNIDEDVMFNAENFVRMQMHVLGTDKDGVKLNSSSNPGYYTLKIGLLSWSLVKNGYDIYNIESSEPPTCAMDMMNEFGIGSPAKTNI